MSQGNGLPGDSSKRPIIDRQTLMPLGITAVMVMGAMSLGYMAATERSDAWNAISNNTAAIRVHDRQIEELRAGMTEQRDILLRIEARQVRAEHPNE